MEYSAGMVKCSFWFPEFRKVIQHLNAGKKLTEIKEKNKNENIFAAPTQARASQIFNAVARRAKSLDQSFYLLFEQSDVTMQKIITLIAIMATDRLFFDFIYEVYREKLILGSDELTDRDLRIFFKDKQLQSKKVAKWRDYTLKRLGTCYKTLLMEAGITDRSTGNRKLLKPILDKSLEDCLRANGMEIMIHALTGVR
ncbi:DUF1819 family protein [Desulfosporosinus meridiei]|uniref:Putative inner membrane protein (DUF1819) n=1 Tax=Desulfosporosinus meridiei (strain ATCC BAA-275 / DSM 13257 / KCTC 12902 / NCIMB 13706 / S10) TaxID=768704 RepID=J7IUQ4_DESMD|nr:DUF1819 family protein [Desulfosporosinus meridiei]AFQ42431.1 Putative inner membrane protein (DUF1819) [Desulfosporosinus meridiei DSM 13257]